MHCLPEAFGPLRMLTIKQCKERHLRRTRVCGAGVPPAVWLGADSKLKTENSKLKITK